MRLSPPNPQFILAIQPAYERALSLLQGNKFLSGMSGSPRGTWQVENSSEEIIGIEGLEFLEDRGIGMSWPHVYENNVVQRRSAKWGEVYPTDRMAASVMERRLRQRQEEMIMEIIDVNDEDYFIHIDNLACGQISAIYRYILYESVAPSAEVLVDIWEHGCICLGWIGTWPTPGHPLVITEIDSKHRLPC